MARVYLKDINKDDDKIKAVADQVLEKFFKIVGL